MRIFAIAQLFILSLPLQAENDLYAGRTFDIYAWIGNRSEEIQVEDFVDYQAREAVISRSEEIKVAVELQIRRGKDEVYPQKNTEPVPLRYQVRLLAECAQSAPWQILDKKVLQTPSRSHASVAHAQCEDLQLGPSVLEVTLFNELDGSTLNQISMPVTIVQ